MWNFMLQAIQESGEGACQEKWEKLEQLLPIPPRYTTLRVNTLATDMLQVAQALHEQLEEVNDM